MYSLQLVFVVLLCTFTWYSPTNAQNIADVLAAPPPPPIADLRGASLVNALTNGTAPYISICIANVPPMVFCNASAPMSTYTGFDVELIRQMNALLDLQEGTDYVFKCLNFKDVISVRTLNSSRTVCDISAAGITITTAREEKGFKFSYPYYNTGLKAVVRAHSAHGSGWRWTTPFTAQLWIAVLLTLLIFPVIVFIIEFGSLKKSIKKTDILPGYEEAIVRSYWTLVGIETLQVVSVGAKVAVAAFAFLALLVTNTYTANLAAVLTVNSIGSQITSVTDLRGKSVITDLIYIPRLRLHYGVLAFPMNESENFANYLDQVRSGELTSVISDAPFIDYEISLYQGCEVRELPDTFEPFSYGLVFRPSTSDDLIDIFSQKILELQELGSTGVLQKNFITTDKNDCGQIFADSASIGFLELYGLWVILGSFCLLGFFIMLSVRFYRTRKARRKHGDAHKDRNRRPHGFFSARKPQQQQPSVNIVDMNVTNKDINKDIDRDAELGRSGDQTQEVGSMGNISGGGAVQGTTTTTNSAESAAIVNRWKHTVEDAVKFTKLQKQRNIFGQTLLWHSDEQSGEFKQSFRENLHSDSD